MVMSIHIPSSSGKGTSGGRRYHIYCILVLLKRTVVMVVASMAMYFIFLRGDHDYTLVPLLTNGRAVVVMTIHIPFCSRKEKE